MEYNSDYDIRLATLAALGGDTTKKYDSVYSIDLEILKITEAGGSGGGGVAPSVIKEIQDEIFQMKGDIADAAADGEEAKVQLNGLFFWSGTEAQYNATEKKEDTIYFIKEG